MLTALRTLIRQFVLKIALAAVVSDIEATGLTDEDRAFLESELNN